MKNTKSSFLFILALKVIFTNFIFANSNYNYNYQFPEISNDEIEIWITKPCIGQNNGIIDIVFLLDQGPYEVEYLREGADGTFQTIKEVNNIQFNSNDEDLRAGVSAGNYIVNIRNADCGVKSFSIVIVTNEDLRLLEPYINPECNNGQNGSIIFKQEIVVEGGTSPYTYLWSNGAHTPSLVELKSGKYILTVTDVNNCEAVGEYFVNPKSVDLLTDHSFDFDCVNNKVILSNYGGKMPYKYIWMDGSTNNYLENASLRSQYWVTITDSEGCSEQTFGETPVKQDLFKLESYDHLTDCSINTGSINLIQIVQNSGVQYNWIGPNGFSSSSLNLSNLAPGKYICTASSGECQQELSIDLCCCNGSLDNCYQGFSSPLYVIGSVKNCSQLGNDGEILINASGGKGNLIFKWTYGGQLFSTEKNISMLLPGVYSLEVYDGCTIVSKQYIVGQEDLCRSYSIEINDLSKCIIKPNEIGEISITANGGIAPYFYEWSTGDNRNFIKSWYSGVYTVTVTDNVGCTSTKVIKLNEGPPISGSIRIVQHPGIEQQGVFGTNPGVLEVIVPSENNYYFEWSTGSNTVATYFKDKGTYTVTISDNCNRTKVLSIKYGNDNQIPLSISDGGGCFDYCDWWEGGLFDCSEITIDRSDLESEGNVREYLKNNNVYVHWWDGMKERISENVDFPLERTIPYPGEFITTIHNETDGSIKTITSTFYDEFGCYSETSINYKAMPFPFEIATLILKNAEGCESINVPDREQQYKLIPNDPNNPCTSGGVLKIWTPCILQPNQTRYLSIEVAPTSFAYQVHNYYDEYTDPESNPYDNCETRDICVFPPGEILGATNNPNIGVGAVPCSSFFDEENNFDRNCPTIINRNPETPFNAITFTIHSPILLLDNTFIISQDGIVVDEIRFDLIIGLNTLEIPISNLNNGEAYDIKIEYATVVCNSYISNFEKSSIPCEFNKCKFIDPLTKATAIVDHCNCEIINYEYQVVNNSNNLQPCNTCIQLPASQCPTQFSIVPSSIPLGTNANIKISSQINSKVSLKYLNTNQVDEFNITPGNTSRNILTSSLQLGQYKCILSFNNGCPDLSYDINITPNLINPNPNNCIEYIDILEHQNQFIVFKRIKIDETNFRIIGNYVDTLNYDSIAPFCEFIYNGPAENIRIGKNGSILFVSNVENQGVSVSCLYSNGAYNWSKSFPAYSLENIPDSFDSDNAYSFLFKENTTGDYIRTKLSQQGVIIFESNVQYSAFIPNGIKKVFEHKNNDYSIYVKREKYTEIYSMVSNKLYPFKVPSNAQVSKISFSNDNLVILGTISNDFNFNGQILYERKYPSLFGLTHNFNLKETKIKIKDIGKGVLIKKAILSDNNKPAFIYSNDQSFFNDTISLDSCYKITDLTPLMCGCFEHNLQLSYNNEMCEIHWVQSCLGYDIKLQKKLLDEWVNIPYSGTSKTLQNNEGGVYRLVASKQNCLDVFGPELITATCQKPCHNDIQFVNLGCLLDWSSSGNLYGTTIILQKKENGNAWIDLPNATAPFPINNMEGEYRLKLLAPSCPVNYSESITASCLNNQCSCYIPPLNFNENTCNLYWEVLGCLDYTTALEKWNGNSWEVLIISSEGYYSVEGEDPANYRLHLSSQDCQDILSQEIFAHCNLPYCFCQENVLTFDPQNCILDWQLQECNGYTKELQYSYNNEWNTINSAIPPYDISQLNNVFYRLKLTKQDCSYLTSEEVFTDCSSNCNIDIDIEGENSNSCSNLLINTNGGIPPYTFSWTSTGTLESEVFLTNNNIINTINEKGGASGYYFITVTDALGCSSIKSISYSKCDCICDQNNNCNSLNVSANNYNQDFGPVFINPISGDYFIKFIPLTVPDRLLIWNADNTQLLLDTWFYGNGEDYECLDVDFGGLSFLKTSSVPNNSAILSHSIIPANGSSIHGVHLYNNGIEVKSGIPETSNILIKIPYPIHLNKGINVEIRSAINRCGSGLVTAYTLNVNCNPYSGQSMIDITSDDKFMDLFLAENNYVEGSNFNSMNIRREENMISVYPNPTDADFVIDIYSQKEELATLTVYNSVGNAIFTDFLPLGRGDNRYILNDSRNWASGFYFLNLKSSEIEYEQKLIKAE